jgi:hypothetical protein
MFFPVPPNSEPIRPRTAEPVSRTRGQRFRAWRRQHPWRFTAWFAVSAFALASVLPIWTAWYIGPWEASGEPATFWQMAGTAWGVRHRLFAGGQVSDFFAPELVKLAVLIVVSVPVGRWLAGRPEPPDVSDYDDDFTPPAGLG